MSAIRSSTEPLSSKHWFAPSELLQCPSCEHRGLVKTGAGDAYCLDCGYLEPAAPARIYDVSCPHCRKQFQKELMTGSAGRYHGFKCPHCRLFVAYERAVERDLIEATKH